MVNLSWHYDLYKMCYINIVPDFNIYMSLGRDWNFGIGAQLPFFVSHATFAKYYLEGDNNYWAAYTHINQLFFGSNNNPYLEFGGAYIDRHNSGYSMYHFGLAYGNGQHFPFLFLFDKFSKEAVTRISSRIIPFIKFNYVGKDFGVSYIHYHGLASTSLKPLQYDVINNNDTLYNFPADSIELITFVGDTGGFIGVYKIFLTDSTEIGFCDNILYPDAFVGNPDKPFERWLGGGYRLFRNIDNYGERGIIANFDKLIEDWKAGRNVVIMNYPNYVKKRIDETNTFRYDHSFGIGLNIWHND